MNNLLKEQKERTRLKKGIGNYDPKKPRTIQDRVEDLERKQYEKGAMIFATQFTSMHNGFVDVLLEHGADTSVRNNKGWTAAHAATVGGHSQIFLTLYENGASVNERDNTGATPAHYAAQADNVEVLMMIHKCQPSPDGESLASTGNTDVLEGRMNNGNTPALARAGKESEIPNFKGSYLGHFPLAHCAALFDSPAALTFLHKVGCDLEARCAYAETPMIKAARAQALRALKYLRDNGSKHAETEHRNVEGDNARALVVDNMRHWRLGVEGEL
ncbi:hypothetical protein JL720_4136 [Aureococcus anophagefferens]|nr:hypothetical protein JL720_4136 [Aureococcus anophagefferens]